MIFDWFAVRDAPPTCILPTFVRNELPSRDRTVCFGQNHAPEVLVPTSSAPLRKIHFLSPDDGMATLPPFSINPKIARYNRGMPPSIRARQAAREPSASGVLSSPALSADDDSAGSPVGDLQPRFQSSLRPALAEPSGSPGFPGASPASFVIDDVSPVYDDEVSDSSYPASDSSQYTRELSDFLAESLTVPQFSPETPLWAKAISNRKALLGKAGAEVSRSPMRLISS